jgi:hypothetical protein
MSSDPTEGARRELVAAINTNPNERAELEKEYGQVWDTAQLVADFEVESFLAPFCIARRRSDGVRGSMMFQHHPRYYFNWSPR